MKTEELNKTIEELKKKVDTLQDTFQERISELENKFKKAEYLIIKHKHSGKETSSIDYHSSKNPSLFSILDFDPSIVPGTLFFRQDHFRGQRASGSHDLCYYYERNEASPIRTFESGLEQLKKIKEPTLLEKEGLAFDTKSFPEEFRVKRVGEKHIDLLPVIGMLIKSQKELLQKIEQLENKLK